MTFVKIIVQTILGREKNEKIEGKNPFYIFLTIDFFCEV